MGVTASAQRRSSIAPAPPPSPPPVKASSPPSSPFSSPSHSACVEEEHKRTSQSLPLTPSSLLHWFICCSHAPSSTSLTQADVGAPIEGEDKERAGPSTSLNGRLRAAAGSFTHTRPPIVRHTSSTIVSGSSHRPLHLPPQDSLPHSTLSPPLPDDVTIDDKPPPPSTHPRLRLHSSPPHDDLIDGIEEVEETFVERWTEYNATTPSPIAVTAPAPHHAPSLSRPTHQRSHTNDSLSPGDEGVHASLHLHPHRYTLPSGSLTTHSRPTYSAHRPASLIRPLPYGVAAEGGAGYCLPLNSLASSSPSSSPHSSTSARTPHSQSHHSHAHYGRADEPHPSSSPSASDSPSSLPPPFSSFNKPVLALGSHIPPPLPSALSPAQKQLRENLKERGLPEVVGDGNERLRDESLLPPGSISAEPSPQSSPPAGRLRRHSHVRTSGMSISTTALPFAGPPSIRPFSLRSPSSISGSGSRPHTATTLTSKVEVVTNAGGVRQFNQYQVMEERGELGRGSYGQVLRVRNVNEGGGVYAMKLISRSRMQKKSRMRRRRRQGEGGEGGSEGEGEGDEEWESVKREIAIMKKLSHPNIVRLYEVIDDPTSDSLYMLMECCEGGTLTQPPESFTEEDSLSSPSHHHPFAVVVPDCPPTPLSDDYAQQSPLSVCLVNGDYLSPLLPRRSLMKGDITSEAPHLSWMRRYLRDLLSGLSYLHSHHILHRDIKPSNLLLSHPYGHPLSTLKIADFGMSEGWGDDLTEEAFHPSRSPTPTMGRTRSLSVNSRMLKSKVGSAAFLSPEQCSRGADRAPDTPHEGGGDGGEWAGRQMDVWAMGVTVYYLVYRVLPFASSSPHQMFHLIVHQSLSFPPISVTPDHSDYTEWLHLQHLMRRLMEKDPTLRMTVEEAKVHPFITKGGQDPMREEEEEDDPTASHMEGRGMQGRRMGEEDWEVGVTPCVSPKAGVAVSGGFAEAQRRMTITAEELSAALTTMSTNHGPWRGRK